MPNAYIYDAVRSPRGRRNGSLSEVSAVRISALMIDAVLERSGVDADRIEDVIWGNVTQVGEQGGCLARAAALMSGLNDEVPGLSVNRFCASGLEAINLAANQVRAGDGDGYIAGGVEMMSRVPMGSDGIPYAVDPQLAIGCHFVPQGISADIIATEFGYSRRDCDRYAVESQRRAAEAWSEGRFAGSVVPVKDRNGIVILDSDEHVRPETDMDSLAGLEPSFRTMGESLPGFDRVAIMKYPHLERIEHVHHPGNSSGIVDGAAAVLVGSDALGGRMDARPRARIRSCAKVGSDPTIMLTGPIPAARLALERAGMTIDDVDLFEINEAFSAVPLRFIEEFGVDPDRINVNGGAIAMGHPLGATGAMIFGTALDELERTGGGTALIALCVGGGMGVATIIERVSETE